MAAEHDLLEKLKIESRNYGEKNKNMHLLKFFFFFFVLSNLPRSSINHQSDSRNEREIRRNLQLSSKINPSNETEFSHE